MLGQLLPKYRPNICKGHCVTFMLTLRQQVSPKRRTNIYQVHDITSQRTRIVIVPGVRTSGLEPRYFLSRESEYSVWALEHMNKHLSVTKEPLELTPQTGVHTLEPFWTFGIQTNSSVLTNAEFGCQFIARHFTEFVPRRDISRRGKEWGISGPVTLWTL